MDHRGTFDPALVQNQNHAKKRRYPEFESIPELNPKH